ncbi:MAG: glucosaminidase domain-containing protein [Burkholderiaceae bacterium]|nr:glucosaminidase domain-containing protein [Burkholderiaceae bacterium]
MPHRHASQHKHVAAPYVTAFISAHAIEAQIVAMKYNIPASAILAQSALESKWGMKAPGNAFFGIKGSKSSGNTVQIATHEVIEGTRKAETDAFRAYDNWADAADDYANLVTTDRRYASLLPHRNDPIKYAEAMGHTPYATGPDYGKLMQAIIQSNNLTQYDHGCPK